MLFMMKLIVVFLFHIFLSNYKTIDSKATSVNIAGRLAPPAPKGPKLDSKKVKESNCEHIQDHFYNVTSTSFISSKATWYVPIASKFFFYNLGESLIKRSLAQSELKKLCPNYLFMVPMKEGGEYQVLISGMGQDISYNCRDSNFLADNCSSLDTAPSYQKQADHVGTIVATDYDKYFVTARCYKKKYKDWAIFTSENKPLEDTLKKSLLSNIASLSFNMNNIVTIKYENCTK